MNELQVYNNEMFGEVHILVIDGQPWFGASDVARALGYTNPQKAIRDHCHEDGCTNRSVTDNTGRERDARFINEGNMYRLIIKSSLPEAERFERWVFDEILPAIRRTGSYLQVARSHARVDRNDVCALMK